QLSPSLLVLIRGVRCDVMTLLRALGPWDSPCGRRRPEDHGARGHEHTAHPLGEADLHVWHLGGGLASQLADGLEEKEHAVHARVGVGEPAAVRVERQPASWRGVALLDE